jgi:hypothetical protein
VVRALLLFLAVLSPLHAADLRPTPVDKQHPGYGVVELVTRVKPEESASAGASGAPGARDAPTFLIRVKLDDGSVQIREIRKPVFTPGERVFITNAGDVVPE